MGVLDPRRPPLPAPTESMDENDTSGGDTEVATNVTTRTDKTHYTIPEDGRPITISTQKITGGGKDTAGFARHGRDKSQTSLLIEYFEASKTGDKSRTRPSVRVKVTPSSAKKSRSGNESVQITSIGSDRKPSFTRRIPLPSSNSDNRGGPHTEGIEGSHSSESNVSGRPPVEIEVLNGSDVSKPEQSSRGLTYAQVGSNVSSMPPDSLLETDDSVLEGEPGPERELHTEEGALLRAPQRTGSRSRSASRDRIAQKVMEKLAASPAKARKSSRSANDYDYEHRRRSSKSQRSEDDAMSGAESMLSSKLNRSERSYRSGTSQASRMTNNPKLLEMVEDTIKRMILPELNAIKQDQKTDRKLRDFDDRRGSVPESGISLERRLSKSSSTPHLTSKPKVVLNRDGDDPGVVLSRGDSERVKTRKSSREHSDRPSSRRSSGRHSREGSYEDDRVRPKSSRSNLGLRGAAAAGLGAGALTAVALKHHDSNEDVQVRRKKITKSRSSRSRSASISESIDEAYIQKDVPPMPLAGPMNDSEVTRESLLSQGTERPASRASEDTRTPTREVSRGATVDAMSPASSRTPTRPTSRNLGMSHTNLPLQSPALESPVLESPASSTRSSNVITSNKARLAALAAAGLGSSALAKSMQDRHVDADGYGDVAPRRKLSSGSPVHSVSSLRKAYEDEPLIPQGLRPRSAASRSSAGHLRESRHSLSSLRSGSSPTTQRLAQSARDSRDVSVQDDEPLASPKPPFWQERSGTPNAETADEWLERQQLINDQYRDSNRDSFQSNPYPEDAKRFTMLTDDSFLERRTDEGDTGEQNVRDVSGVGLNPGYMNTPVAVESAVASLMEPSTISSNALSPVNSPRKPNGTYSDRMHAQLRELDQEKAPLYEGSTLSQNMLSQERWTAIKGHARQLPDTQSPTQSPVRDVRELRSGDEQLVLGTSGMPVADDPMPEIGHFDSKSDLTTNPSIIQGPLGGDATGKSTWPYTPEPEQNGAFTQEGYGKKGLGTATAAGVVGGAAALAAAHAARQPKLEDDHLDINRNGPEARSPPVYPDEGYATDARTRSGGAITPRQKQVYGKDDVNDYHRAMDAQDLGDQDPFAAEKKHLRHFSGNSHGMESPLYDASTGKGIDRIQSKDVVALMDHLTVRDAQRNARDTEILTSLVRSAAEMRQSFDEMKKFIVEQDKMIMQNTDRAAEYTAQKVLGGPRPQPVNSPRTPRRAANSEEENQSKRKGVLQRALKGLTKGKSSKDLARIEDMLMQILDNVEDLKHQNGGPVLERSYTMDSVESYEKLRPTQDSGYEPEGQAGTSSTPSQSGHFPVTPREKHQFHSGYDGRRGSDNRVSTVLEEDDDELEPHEAHVLNHQFENNEHLRTPTQERERRLELSPKHTPPQRLNAQDNEKTPDKKQKHKSTSSSLFGGIPKISRWSKTTASSAPDPVLLDSPKQAHGQRQSSESSRSRSTLDDYDDDGYSLRDDDRIRSIQSLAREQNGHAPNGQARSLRSQASSRITRTPSPLVPSEVSAKEHYSYGDQIESPVQEDDDVNYDDPKYHAHRNSLLLEHPQPRQGTTSRHQNTLESRAHNFDDTTGTNSDLSQVTVSDFDPAVWGSSGTAGLARHRLAQADTLSPISITKKGSDEGPLIPQQKPAVPPKVRYEEEQDDELDWEPQYSNSGFSRGGYYDSPYGSGHLLEPIAEVRYSLETDSGKISPEPEVASAKAIDTRSPGRRNLTGPRPMTGSGRSIAAAQPKGVGPAGTGTVTRKPIPGQRSSKDSFDSETL